MPTLPAQRGAATLIVTLLLFFVAALVAAFASRHHVIEQRAAVNQVRAAQAFEAAEAGIDWATALLNQPQAIDGRCLPADGAGNLRDRLLAADVRTGRLQPLTWNDAGQPAPLRATCTREDAAWACRCPSAAAPVVAAAASEPSFVVELAAAAQPGIVQLVSNGSAAGDAKARTQVTLGLVPGLATLPIAPLTLKGSLQAEGAALGVHNGDAGSGGRTVHAGANVIAPAARIDTAPGGDTVGSIIDNDAELAATSDERLFTTFFGLDKALWQQQPGVARIDCSGSCTAALLDKLAAMPSNRRLWVDGDLLLDGPATLGSRDNPVILVVRGSARFSGAVAIHGLVYAGSLSWNDSAPGATLRGAAVSESGYTGNGAPDFVYDTSVLAALQTRVGTLARVPGSWKDF